MAEDLGKYDYELKEKANRTDSLRSPFLRKERIRIRDGWNSCDYDEEEPRAFVRIFYSILVLPLALLARIRRNKLERGL